MKKEEKIKAALKVSEERLNNLLHELEKLKPKVEMLRNAVTALEMFHDDEEEVNNVKPTERKSTSGKQSLRDVMTNSFEDMKPKKARDLFEIYKEAVGNPDLKFISFSPRLSKMVKLNVLKKHERESPVPQSERCYYGTPQMFNGEKLKDEYEKYIG